MGVIYSIPLCARGDAKDGPAAAAAAVPERTPGTDANNNAPMPALQPIATQPTARLDARSLANDNAAPYDDGEASPEATSTPKSGLRRVIPADDMSSDDIIDVDDEDALTGGDRTSDSGLEQSSSDELELGAAGRPVSRREQRASPPAFNADEGINEETLDVTLPLDNHLTCDEDDGSTDEEEDPVERPPEPTVPDERVDSSDGSRQESVSPSVAKKDPTANAISSLLSEIVGDHPYEERHAHQVEGTALAR